MRPYTVTVGNSFLWTTRGLKTVYSLEVGDVILGINREGRYTWQKLNHHPLPKGRGELIHIVTDRSEIAIHSECSLCGVGELIKPKNINVGTRLSVFHEDTLIPVWLAKQPECAQSVFVNGQEIPLTESVAYLIGAATRRLPWSENRLIIKVPKPQLEEAKKKLVEKLRRIPQLRDKPKLDVESGQVWSWIVIRSKFIIKLVEALAKQPNVVPLAILRSPSLVCCNFARGYIDMACIRAPDEDEIRIQTELYESELRRFLYNIFVIHFIRCATIAFPSYQPFNIILKTSMSELKLMLKKSLNVKSLEAYSQVRAHFKSLEPTYVLPIEKYGWSPMIDLMMLPI